MMMLRNFALFVMFLLVSLLSACSGGTGSKLSSGTTEVTVALQAPPSDKAVFYAMTSTTKALSFSNYTSRAKIPDEVATLVITTSGADFDSIVVNKPKSSTLFPVKLTVPNGKNRTITIEGKISDGTVKYVGKATLPTLDGTPVTQPISVVFVAPLSKLYGGVNDDNQRGISLTKDDGYFIFGNTRSYSVSNSQLLALKVKSSGAVIWQKLIGPSAARLAASDQLDAKGLATSDGGFVAGGKLLTLGGSSLSFSKFDVVGSLLWQRQYNGATSRTSEITDYRQTQDGGYIIASNTWSFDPATGGPFYYDFWVLKLDDAGTVKWHTTIRVTAGGSDNRFGAIRQTTDGGYMLVGVTDGNLASRSLCMVKLDADGNVTWSKVGYKPASNYIQNPANSASRFVPFQPSGDGGYIVPANVRSLDNITPFGALIFKADASGTVIWQNIYGKLLGFTASSLVPSTDDGFIVYGSYTAAGGGSLIFKIDAQGKVLWDKRSAITNTQTGQILLKGDGNFMALNSKQLVSGGDWDLWLLKINSPTAEELATSSTLDVSSALMPASSPGAFTTTYRPQNELGLVVPNPFSVNDANLVPQDF